MTAQTPAQRKAAERQRHKEAGRTEVRGIYAKPADHAAIKAHAAKLARKRGAFPLIGVTMDKPSAAQVEREQRQASFRNELQELLNRHSMENESNTPDYMLADYLIQCLKSLDEAINRRSSWYGKFDSPGQAALPTME